GLVARPRSDLDVVEGQFRAPDAAPALDEFLHVVAVFHALPDVALALIPGDAAQGEGVQRGDHAVVHAAGLLLLDQPRLDGRAAPRAIDQADRHIEVLLHADAEVIEHGRESADGLRRAD